MEYKYKYPRPAVTADCVVMTKERLRVGDDKSGIAVPQVLLIERGAAPYKGGWAFPGGFMNMDETTEQCAVRELEEDTPLAVTGQDDAAKAQWFPIDNLPPLAFDHEDIMRDAIKKYKCSLNL